MSYRCGLCRDVVGPGVARQVHVVQRTVQPSGANPLRKEVMKEIPVCPGCAAAVKANSCRKTGGYRPGVAVDF